MEEKSSKVKMSTDKKKKEPRKKRRKKKKKSDDRTRGDQRWFSLSTNILK
jgi:hypothetical protein